MLRTVQSLPQTGLSTLGSGPARFQTKPPACYRASWQLPGPDFHRQATTSLRTRGSTMAYVTVSPPVLLGARDHLSGTDRKAFAVMPCTRPVPGSTTRIIVTRSGTGPSSAGRRPGLV